MKKHSWKKIGCLLLAMLMMATMLATGVVAISNYDPNQMGSITFHKFEQEDHDDPSWPTSNVTADGKEIKDQITLDGLGKPLDGVIFTAYAVPADATDTNMSIDGLKAYVAPATQNGVSTIVDLPVGRYLVKETQPAPNTTKITPNFFVDIPMTNPEGDGWIYDVHVYPKNALVHGDVTLEKVDENGNALEGAVFGLYTEDGTKIAEITSTADGIQYSNLPVGNYYLQEITAPDGYTLSTTKYVFEISAEKWSYNFTTDQNTKAINFKQLDKDALDKKNTSTSGARDINWQLTAQIPGDIELYRTYSITDTLPDGLGTAEAVKNLTVKADGSDLGTNAYIVTKAGKTFTINFIDKSALAGKKAITITFTTEIEEGAAVGTVTNNAVLTYQSETGDKKTVTATATANIYGIDVTKVNLAGTRLPGAEFELKDDKGNVVYTGTTDAEGKFIFKGLNQGTYYLVETAAPDGYKVMSKPLEIVIDDNTQDYLETVTILNTKNISLPITGGIGTLIFTFSGIALMGAAALLYIRSRRKSSAEA